MGSKSDYLQTEKNYIDTRHGKGSRTRKIARMLNKNRRRAMKYVEDSLVHYVEDRI